MSTDAKNLTFLIFLAWHFASPTCARMEKGTLNEKRERERGEAFVVCSKTLNTARDHTIILCGPEPNFVFKNLPKTSLSRNSKFLRTNKILENFDKKLFFAHLFFTKITIEISYRYRIRQFGLPMPIPRCFSHKIPIPTLKSHTVSSLPSLYYPYSIALSLE